MDPPPALVLFDIDGTILDADLSIRETMNRVLTEHRQPTFSKEELGRLIGNPLRMILSQKCKDPAVVESMAHRYREAYSESGWVLADLFPGAEGLLRDLRGAGVRTGIVSSKGQGESERLLVDMGIRDLFDVVAGDDDARPVKPDPAPVVHCCEALAIPPPRTAMVGDTRFDILAGRAAGAWTVGVTWGNGSVAELREAGAHEIARDMRTLGRMLGV